LLSDAGLRVETIGGNKTGFIAAMAVARLGSVRPLQHFPRLRKNPGYRGR
jgi:hypothetical protein